MSTEKTPVTSQAQSYPVPNIVNGPAWASVNRTKPAFQIGPTTDRVKPELKQKVFKMGITVQNMCIILVFTLLL
jgi:hypothetical protein